MQNEHKFEIRILPLKSALSKHDLLEISKSHNIHIFDLDSIKSELQIRLAFLHADLAFKEKRNISKSESLEILSKLAGTRQISEAILIVGIKNPEKIIAAYRTDKVKISEKEVKCLFKAKTITWKQKDDSEEIRKMVESEINE